MDEPLDDLYLTWLYKQTGSVKLKNRTRTYWSILRLLYTKQFVWFIPNDDNRVEDGKDLRYEFIHEEGIQDLDDSWMTLGCSMLELFVSLSRRLAFEDDGKPRDWFWQLIHNLELDQYNDSVHIPLDEIEALLDRVIWRTYDPDGSGGLFPLRWPERDQRDVELWYQLSAYILEQD